MTHSFDLKLFRKINKITQAQLSEYLGVTQAFISQIEKGARPLPDEYISKIKAEHIYTIPEKVSFDVAHIIEKIMEAYHFKTKLEFAEHLGIKPQTLSSWESRNTIDYTLIYTKCKNINGDWLLSGEGSVIKDGNFTNDYSDHLEKAQLLHGGKYSDDFVEQLMREHERLVKCHENVSNSLLKVSDSHQKLTETHYILTTEFAETSKEQRNKVKRPRKYVQSDSINLAAEKDVKYGKE